jgi:hypothetical protein
MKLHLTQSIFLTLTIAATATIDITASPAVAANLVQNGSFEQTGNLNRKNWGTFDNISGWQALSGSKIEVQRGVAGKAYDGMNLVELDSHDNAPNAPVLGLFQDIQTTIGQAYTLSFFYSPRPGVGAGQNVFSVLFGDSFKQVLDSGIGNRETNWTQYIGTVVASSELTRLQFNYEGPRNTYGAYIDDVKLTETSAAVPEPATMTGMAIAGLALTARKRLKRHATV